MIARKHQCLAKFVLPSQIQAPDDRRNKRTIGKDDKEQNMTSVDIGMQFKQTSYHEAEVLRIMVHLGDQGHFGFSKGMVFLH